MSKNDPADDSALADYEKAKEIANSCKSLEDVTDLWVQAMAAGEGSDRPFYWAIMHYDLINNDVPRIS